MNLHPARARAWLAALVMIIGLAGAAPAPVVLARAPAASALLQQAPASHLDVVTVAYQGIVDDYYDPVDGTALLDAAWSAAVAAAGIPAGHQSPAAPTRPATLDAFTAAYPALEAVSSVDPTRLAYAAVRGMTGYIDNIHTFFLEPAQAEAQRAALEGGDPVGLGFRRTIDGPPWNVLYIAPGGPAELAGIHAGDAVLAYDGDSSANAPAVHGTGRPGTPITLTVQRPGEATTRQVPVVLAAYHLPTLETRVIDSPAGPVGYLRFFAWESGTAQTDAIRDALAGFEAQGVFAWVLDLRANGGGYLESVAGLFMPRATLMRLSSRGGESRTVESGADAVTPARPLVILIGPGSASASEIVPEALRRNGRAVLVGERTPGAMATTLEIPLPDNSAVWVTREHVAIGADGPDLDGVGIEPDLYAPQTPLDLAHGNDPGLDAAISFLQGR